jgi:REP element-mobilizing transposase RayT
MRNSDMAGAPKTWLARICNPCHSIYSPCLVFLDFLHLFPYNFVTFSIFFHKMSEKYKIWDQNKAYFLTLSVVGWIDVFTRKNHKLTIVDSLKYCQKKKGLVIYGYCLMPSHLHLIARAEDCDTLSDILRDFKKFTAKAILNQIADEPESRRD